MPYISVQLSSAISKPQSDNLAIGITQILNKVLGKKEELTAVNISDNSSKHWYIGNHPIDIKYEHTVYVDIKISANTNTDEEKQEAIAKLYALFTEELGHLSEISYITIDEVPMTNWGYGGKTQYQRSIKRTKTGNIDTDFYLVKGRKERAYNLTRLAQLFR